MAPVSIHNSVAAFMTSGATLVKICPSAVYKAAAPPHPEGYLLLLMLPLLHKVFFLYSSYLRLLIPHARLVIASTSFPVHLK